MVCPFHTLYILICNVTNGTLVHHVYWICTLYSKKWLAMIGKLGGMAFELQLLGVLTSTMQLHEKINESFYTLIHGEPVLA
jgi:hypothetical protein